MNGTKEEEIRIGDEVSDELFHPKTIDQLLSMIRDYGHTHGLSAREVSEIFSVGYTVVAQRGASVMLPPASTPEILRMGLIVSRILPSTYIDTPSDLLNELASFGLELADFAHVSEDGPDMAIPLADKIQIGPLDVP